MSKIDTNNNASKNNPEAIYKEAGVHFKLITAIKPSLLKLTKFDDEIMEVFRKIMPDLDVTSLEQSIFTADTENKWQQFYDHFEGKVDNMKKSSFLRTDCREMLCTENIIMVTRGQWLAIEITRNKEGKNDQFHDQWKEMQAQRAASGGGCCSRC